MITAYRAHQQWLQGELSLKVTFWSSCLRVMPFVSQVPEIKIMKGLVWNGEKPPYNHTGHPEIALWWQQRCLNQLWPSDSSCEGRILRDNNFIFIFLWFCPSQATVKSNQAVIAGGWEISPGFYTTRNRAPRYPQVNIGKNILIQGEYMEGFVSQQVSLGPDESQGRLNPSKVSTGKRHRRLSLQSQLESRSGSGPWAIRKHWWQACSKGNCGWLWKLPGAQDHCSTAECMQDGHRVPR